MEPGKKKPTVKYNIQKLNDVGLGYSNVKKIARELQNIDLNQTSDSIKSEMVWNRTKEAVVSSITGVFRMEPNENKKNLFNDIFKNA